MAKYNKENGQRSEVSINNTHDTYYRKVDIIIKGEKGSMKLYKKTRSTLKRH